MAIVPTVRCVYVGGWDGGSKVCVCGGGGCGATYFHPYYIIKDIQSAGATQDSAGVAQVLPRTFVFTHTHYRPRRCLR